MKPPCDQAVIATGHPAIPCAKSVEPWVLAVTILGSSTAFIDGTVVNVALPAVQRTLGGTVIDMQWVVEGYALFLSALILAGGATGDVFGRRRMFLAGVTVFAIASAGCGLAGNIRELVIARAVQGFGAAFLVPGSLSIISASFGEKERGRCARNLDRPRLCVRIPTCHADLCGAVGGELGFRLAHDRSGR